MNSFSGHRYQTNVTNLRVFDDDQQIIDFLTNDENFKDSVIDNEQHQDNLQSGNFMPKGVRTLEGMFDLDNKFRRPTVIADFTTPSRSHIYGLPCPSTYSLDPMDLYYALMFLDHPPKFPIYTFT